MSQAIGGPDQAESRSFDEKAYRRQTLAYWENKWRRLSSLARYYFLNQVRDHIQYATRAVASFHPSFNTFPTGVTEELLDAGFVDLTHAFSRARPDRMVARAEVYDFTVRANILRKYHLLERERLNQLAIFVGEVYFPGPLTEVLSGVLHSAGIPGSFELDDLLKLHVTDHLWPGLVAASLNEPLADRILNILWKTEQPIALGELPGQLEGANPDEVRAVLHKLVARMAVFEDIRPATWEIVVGLIPALRERMAIAQMPTKRPPLLKSQSLKEIAPDGSPLVNDIRAVLIEIASAPPQLRKDHTLFQYESERFEAALDPLPSWLLNAMKWSADGRPNRAIAWALALRLGSAEPSGKHIRLDLTAEGHAWLANGASDDLVQIYEILRDFYAQIQIFSHPPELFLPGMTVYDITEVGDSYVLGTPVTSLRVETGKRTPRHWDARPDDRVALRNQIDLALSVLKPAVFYRLDSVESHVVFADLNPLNLGLPAEQVAVFLLNRSIPPARPRREAVGKEVINTFVLQRLVAFGCVRAALDDRGRICIAREPRYDAFFGRQIVPSVSNVANVPAKVVIQPDFSVVVIGLNPAPVAALAPFCERTTRGGGHGAIVMKITRESVVKAVSNGLKPLEIVARLEGHASNKVPANVLRQVQEWSNWVRRVTCSPLIAVRCPDSETADRVMAVLKRQAERVNPTIVAIDREKLTTGDRNKLQAHGILVSDEIEDGS